MSRDLATTLTNFVNPRGQEVIQNAGKAGTSHGQYINELKWQHYSQHIAANGSDIHERKCPAWEGGRRAHAIG